jgi:hypothetical protein
LSIEHIYVIIFIIIVHFGISSLQKKNTKHNIGKTITTSVLSKKWELTMTVNSSSAKDMSSKFEARLRFRYLELFEFGLMGDVTGEPPSMQLLSLLNALFLAASTFNFRLKLEGENMDAADADAPRERLVESSLMLDPPPSLLATLLHLVMCCGEGELELDLHAYSNCAESK